MAGRATQPASPPWDTNCLVTTLIGGYAAMCAMRDALQSAIDAAKTSALAFGQRGHVYITDWRFNCQRDLSDANSWGTNTWDAPPGSLNAHPSATNDYTALGLVLKLMQAGISVRIMVWLPSKLSEIGAGAPHVEDHFYLAHVVAKENARLMSANGLSVPIGVVALDARTSEGDTMLRLGGSGAHHQKTMVIRVDPHHVAFAGGVDLAFTRRDAPNAPPAGSAPVTFNAGDWQSGGGIPNLKEVWPPGSTIWPPETGVDYSSLAAVPPPADKQPSDLPENDTSNPGQLIYGATNQSWHDQHLQLQGPVVQTLEQQFCERWVDTCRSYDLSNPPAWRVGQVIFSTTAAFTSSGVTPLESPATATSPAGASSTVQMLRTIPWRESRTGPPFRQGEFTVMSGVSKAVGAAKHLIWIFDQYFWSLPLARQLNFQLSFNDDVYVIVILPPYADTQQGTIHRARQLAINALMTGNIAPQRAAVYNLWHPGAAGQARGIYCHAKVQIYDGDLMICGSANMNRRSFNCDSEIACSVLDSAVVGQHQRNLWQLLFGSVAGSAGQWPAPDFTSTTAGRDFFQAFQTAAKDSDSFLIPDPSLQSNPTLPTGVEYPLDWPPPSPKFDLLYGKALDPSSLDLRIESWVWDSVLPRQPRLDDVVKRIEDNYEANTLDPTGASNPWRRGNAIL